MAGRTVTLLVVFVVVIWMFIVQHCHGEPSVLSPVGRIIGKELEFDYDGRALKVHQYLGIPYGEPPVGSLRFQKPVRKGPFTAPFRAVDYGPACLQLGIGYPGPANTAEDCLFLNVFVPAGNGSSPPDTGYPVMVWIYGGGFRTGDSNSYDSSTLSGFGHVIVVTLNYRLGILGFLSSGDEQLPGNYGLWDQHCAIRWVHDNIAAFGGDPSRVTLFGQSAGAISIQFQSLYIGNKNLFQGVIAESGSLSMAGVYTETVRETASVIGSKLGCNNMTNAGTIDSRALRECLLSVPEHEIAEVQNTLFNDTDASQKVKLMPCFDNDFIKLKPEDFVMHSVNEILPEERLFSSINFIIGVNSKEGAVYISQFLGIEDPEHFVVQPQQMATSLVPAFLRGQFPDGYPAELGDLVLSEYTNWTMPDDPVCLRDMYVKMLGDTFVFPALKVAKKHVQLGGSGTSYLYHFRVKPSHHVLPTPSWVDGANHGDEVGFVFGFDKNVLKTLSLQRTAMPEPQNWELKLAKEIMTIWTNFAKSGNPNVPEDAQSNVGAKWSEYDLEGQRYLEIDERAMTLKQRLDARGDNFWLNLVPRLRQMGKQECPLEKSRSSGGETSFRLRQLSLCLVVYAIFITWLVIAD